MQIQNSEVAQKFNQLANLLEIEGANRFRIRAYRNAARTLQGFSENVADLVHQEADLTLLPGIGKDLAAKIKEIVDTGHLALLDQIEQETPAALTEFLKIPSIGPKRVQQLYRNCGVKSLDDLKIFAESKKLLEVRGFGEKTRLGILEGIKKIQELDRPRLKLNEAQNTAKLVTDYLRMIPVQKLTVAGSLRRKQETVGDLDILVTAKKAEDVIEHFLKFESIHKVIATGPTRTSVLLRSGVQIDLRIVPDASYGAALLYFTGSKAHNIALRTMAMKRGLKINEYGIFKNTKVLASRTETEIYKILKLPYIEPELRENTGEIEAAISGTLPKLVQPTDIKGDLHVHTTATDGADSIEDLANEAQSLGYSYIGITDHSRKLTVAHGLDPKRLLSQLDQIDRLNESLKGITILKSIEVDILEDGQLDLPDEILKRLDYTVCAVHSNFHLSKQLQTERILRAMRNPHFTILAHPFARLIGGREPIEIDFEKVLQTAKKLNRILEINCQPERMDLSEANCRIAKALGVKMVISTDAHSLSQLKNMEFGIGQARRGWLEPSNIINTLSLRDLKSFLRNNKEL